MKRGLHIRATSVTWDRLQELIVMSQHTMNHVKKKTARRRDFGGKTSGSGLLTDQPTPVAGWVAGVRQVGTVTEWSWLPARSSGGFESQRTRNPAIGGRWLR